MISILDLIILIFSFQCVLASPVPLSARFPGSTLFDSKNHEHNGLDAMRNGARSTPVMSLSLTYSPLSKSSSESNTKDSAGKGQPHKGQTATTEVVVTQTVLTTMSNNAQHKPTRTHDSQAHSTKVAPTEGTTFTSFPVSYQTPSLENLSSQTLQTTKKSNHSTTTRTMQGTGSASSTYASSLTPIVLTTLVPILSPIATTATYTTVPLKSTPSWVEPEPSTTSAEQSATAMSTPCPDDHATSLQSLSSTATLTLTSTIKSTATVSPSTSASSHHTVNQVAATVITIATTITKHLYTATAEATVTATFGKS